MMLVIFKASDTNPAHLQLELHMLVHDILHALFLCSPLVAPIVFVFRISAVKKYVILKFKQQPP